MTSRSPFLSLAALLPLAAVVAACGSSSAAPPGNTAATDAGPIDAGPVQGTYTIDFPSLSVAVDTDSVQVFVFDAGDANNQCLDLIQTQKGGGTLPPSLTPTQPVSLCKLEGAGAGDLTIGFGNYAVLVVAEKTGAGDIAIGCQQQTISASAPTMTITLEIAPGVAVPTTSCTSLSLFCSNSCG